jgi:hypothetical protein
MITVPLFVWVAYRTRTVDILTLKESNTDVGWLTMGIDRPCSCTDSDYGRTIYIKPDYDPRLFPPVPRHSATFKAIFKRRTSVERSNKRILTDYNIENGRCRSSKQRFARATFAEVNIHLDAWLKHTAFSIVDLIDQAVAVA